MTALSRTARETIKWATFDVPGASIVGYVRHVFGREGKWHGDSCGCPDDRCIGHHHDEGRACECLPIVLDEYVCGARGHAWSDKVREADYGRGPVRWRNCTSCHAADYLSIPEESPANSPTAVVACTNDFPTI